MGGVPATSDAIAGVAPSDAADPFGSVRSLLQSSSGVPVAGRCRERTFGASGAPAECSLRPAPAVHTAANAIVPISPDPIRSDSALAAPAASTDPLVSGTPRTVAQPFAIVIVESPAYAD